MRRLVRGLAAAALLVGMLLAGARDAIHASLINRNSSVIRIGVLLPTSGTFAYAANEIDNGIRAYVQQYGDVVAGKRLEFFRQDTGNMDQEAVRRYAQDLVRRDRVDVFVGFMLTRDVVAVAPTSISGRRLMVVMNAPSPGVTGRSPYMVRTGSSSGQLAEPLGTWAATAGGIKTCYTLVTNLGSGPDFEAGFTRAFKEAGGAIVGSARLPAGELDLSAYVQRIKDANPQAMMVYVSPRGQEQAEALAKALTERGIDPAKIKVLGFGENTSDDSLRIMGDASLGMITAWHYDTTNNSPRNSAFVKLYNEMYGYNPGFGAVSGYDGMHLVYQALVKTGGYPEGSRLIEVLKGLRWESPRGYVSIDRDTRDIVQTVYVRKVQKAGGALQNVVFDKVENVKDPPRARGK